jgi:hypothetical protein
MESVIVELKSMYTKHIRDKIDVLTHEKKLSNVVQIQTNLMSLKFCITSYHVMLRQNIGDKKEIEKTLNSATKQIIQLCETLIEYHIKNTGKRTKAKLTKIINDNIDAEIQCYSAFSKIDI